MSQEQTEVDKSQTETLGSGQLSLHLSPVPMALLSQSEGTQSTSHLHGPQPHVKLLPLACPKVPTHFPKLESVVTFFYLANPGLSGRQ